MMPLLGETKRTSQATDSRPTIKFQGLYLSIYNEKTHDRKIREENVSEYTEFEVPKGYTAYVRGVKMVSFKS
jgi:hypothetical protein